MDARSIFAVLALTVPTTSATAASASTWLRRQKPTSETPAPAAKPRVEKPKPAPVTPQDKQDAAQEKRLRTAFAALTTSEKKDIVDYFELESGRLPTFQNTLITWVLKQQDRDPLDWRESPKLTYFDPVVHAPAQPISRTWLDAKSPMATKALATFLDAPTPRALRRAFVYDYGLREIVRVPFEDEVARVFENALAGHPRRLDLAEALVERMIDDGAEQKAAQAFAHAYTDRSGHAFPGVTLFDAYRSGAEIEMPDVDTLGIVHALFDDWKTWTAPVAGGQQEALYDKIGDAFVALNRHVALRRAIVATYMQGSAPLKDGYASTLDNLHALWEDCESMPDKLAARLPAAKDTSDFLAAWVKRCYKPDGPFKAGQHRREVLDQNARDVRATLERVMNEYGAFNPRAPAETAKKPAETPHKQVDVPRERDSDGAQSDAERRPLHIDPETPQ